MKGAGEVKKTQKYFHVVYGWPKSTLSRFFTCCLVSQTRWDFCVSDLFIHFLGSITRKGGPFTTDRRKTFHNSTFIEAEVKYEV